MITPYDIVKVEISKGNYKLEEMLRKITNLFLLRELSEVQTDELRALALSNASTESERPELIKLVDALIDKIAAIESRLSAVESGKEPGEEINGDQSEYPEWKPWDGISKDYTMGAIVYHDGGLWKSIFAGQNVWQPGAVGTESLWERVE